jgi:hypothetical protein
MKIKVEVTNYEKIDWSDSMDDKRLFIGGYFVNNEISLVGNYKPTHIWFNGLNTTCEFPDGEKITVSPSCRDDYDIETGVAMCIIRKMFGTRGAWKRFIKENSDFQSPKEKKLKKDKVTLETNPTLAKGRIINS